ncbi:hypothetical protein DFH08DRAFT_1019066 [Mycena albidolilacea]|uniref:Uncharacterized protein n=1 Tax=Mycena albidolilacea TaxID=1033008 RepID=A0AAD6ZQW4_9AGAR|nr:hypothetical protein DFH08DRAFT_1019066 [Mycena albidolilacea]
MLSGLTITTWSVRITTGLLYVAHCKFTSPSPMAHAKAGDSTKTSGRKKRKFQPENDGRPEGRRWPEVILQSRTQQEDGWDGTAVKAVTGISRKRPERIRKCMVVTAADDKTVPKELQKDPFKNNPSKTTTMVTAIGENESYRNKLYPPPGQNQSTAEGEGLSKAYIYWELFKLLWGNDYPKFVKYLERGKAKEREVITDKIKLEKETKKIQKDMKQTGEGNKMTQQELDALPEDDECRSAWGCINSHYGPQMDDLIGKWPNSQPVAVGNSNSEEFLIVDANNSIADSSDGPAIDVDNNNNTEDPIQAKGDAGDSNTDSITAVAATGSKRKKTAVQQSSYTRANSTTAPGPAYKKGKVDIDSVVKQEQETQRRQLDLAAIKANTELERMKAHRIHTKEVNVHRAEANVLKEKCKLDEAAFQRKMQILKAQQEFGIKAVRAMFPDKFSALSIGSKTFTSPGPSQHSSPGPSHPHLSLASDGFSTGSGYDGIGFYSTPQSQW